jgi:anti-anti-sigma regulatory factor
MALGLRTYSRGSSDTSKMTLKIEKYADGNSSTIRLIGRMQAEHLEELAKQIRENGPSITLDLDEVTLVDVEIVRFLGTCEARGATLLNCSPYIRDWIGKERS